MKKRLFPVAVLVLCIQLAVCGTGTYAQIQPFKIKELNFVFLHGMNGNAGAMQLLADCVEDKMAAYKADYETQNPDTKVVIHYLNRTYSNNVDIDTWARNIADSIEERFYKSNLILIGHSMGGKTALYTTARNIGNLVDDIQMVVTINSPIKEFSGYYFTGGLDYWRAQGLVSEDEGVLNSIAYYDSSEDGKWVGTYKHWLAFASAESSPQSTQFDTSGVDPLPRDMDDTIVPISAQYADGADVVYYGEHSHSEFNSNVVLANLLAEYILRYIFGGYIEYSVLSDSGTFTHQAGILPVLGRWDDVTGEIPISNDTRTYKNSSFTHWQEWIVDIGEASIDGRRGTYELTVHSLPFISGLIEAGWLNEDDETDARLLVRLRAAPRTSVRIDWSINGFQPPMDVNRDHYEVEIVTGTPFTGIEGVSWITMDPDDFRLYIQSSAEGPLRWFTLVWRTYHKETYTVKVVDDMPTGGADLPAVTAE